MVENLWTLLVTVRLNENRVCLDEGQGSPDTWRKRMRALVAKTFKNLERYFCVH